MKEMTLNKVLSLCELRGFLRLVNSEMKVESSGALVMEFLRREWFNSLVVNKDFSVFASENDVSATFNFAKEMCLQSLPFMVASVEKDRGSQLDASGLRCRMFVAPSDAMQFFHQWQVERKMWWRKFSASPGRYYLGDVKNNEDQVVAILAKYPWGDQLVETLSIISTTPKGFTESQLEIKDGRKTVQAQCILSEVSSSTMLLNTLYDAYDDSPFQGRPRPILRLHRKLAPYKLGFSISSSKKSTVDELKDLAVYICRQLRTNQVSCLLTPMSYKNSLESQWTQYDEMGIPYTVHLNEETLRTGIILLRSRDTTLKEQVHISDLNKYVEQLFRNY